MLHITTSHPDYISVLDSIYPCSCRTSAKPKLFSLTLEGVPNLNGAHMSLILRLGCCPLCLTKSSVFVTVCVAITVGQHYPPTHRMQKHSSRIKKLTSHWQQRWQAQTCSSCSLPLCFLRLSAGKQCKLRAYALGKIEMTGISALILLLTAKISVQGKPYPNKM